MYRLKNLKSHKLVQRQGQALGAHARGEHREAIAKLAEVAEAAVASLEVVVPRPYLHPHLSSQSHRPALPTLTRLGSK